MLDNTPTRSNLTPCSSLGRFHPAKVLCRVWVSGRAARVLCVRGRPGPGTNPAKVPMAYDPERCPFHDDGTRFSCHLAPGGGHTRPSLQHVPPLDAYEVLAGRTLLFLGDSVTRQVYNTARCHLCASAPMRSTRECARGPKPGPAFQKEWEAFPIEAPVCTAYGHCGKVCYLTAGSRGSWRFKSNAAAVSLALNSSSLGPRPVIVANDGIWYTRGAPSSRGDWSLAVSQAVHRAKQLTETWRGLGAGRRQGACLLWRETSPQSFPTKPSRQVEHLAPTGLVVSGKRVHAPCPEQPCWEWCTPGHENSQAPPM